MDFYLKFKEPFIAILRGPPNIGKSFCIRNMVYSCSTLKYMDRIYVVCADPDHDGYRSYIPEGNIYSYLTRTRKRKDMNSLPEWECPLLSNLINHQKINPDSRCWLILDGCLDMISLRYHEEWKRTLSQCKAYGISVIISTHHVNRRLPPYVKYIATHVLIWKYPCYRKRQVLHRDFLHGSGLRKDALSLLHEHHFLFMDHVNNRYEGIYNMKSIPDFKLICS